MKTTPLITNDTDPYMVEVLVHAAMAGMEHASIPDITTPSEILSAAFTVLQRTLAGLRKLQASEDAASNTKEINRVLQDFLTDYGSIPN
jgi:hypothetical protein